LKYLYNPATDSFESMEPTLRDRFALGGGVIQGEKVGDRENFVNPTRKYLPESFTPEFLQTELNKGKTFSDIATDIYNQDPEKYDKLSKELKGRQGTIGKLRANIMARIAKNKAFMNKGFIELDKKNQTTQDAYFKKARTDLKKFIKDNASKYISGRGNIVTGGYVKFEKAVLDFMKKNYPKAVKTTQGVGKNLVGEDWLKGIFTSDTNFGATEQALATRKKGGYYSFDNEVESRNALQRVLRKALKLPYKFTQAVKNPGKKGRNTYSSYMKNLRILLPIAQEKGFVPKTIQLMEGNRYGTKVMKTIPLTPERYFNWATKQIGPMKKIFGNVLKFSVEHPGGIARAVELLDAESLAKIQAQEFGAFEEGRKNKNLKKGTKYDSQLTKLIREAKYEAKSVTAANKILAKANALSNKMNNIFGTLQSKYQAVKLPNGTIQINTKHPDISLNDSLVSKTKNAIHTFIANDGINRKGKQGFSKLPKKMQEAIILISEGKNADKIIASHIKDVIPEYEKVKNIKLPSFAGAIDASNVSPELLNKISNVAKKIVPVLKGLGYTTGPLQTIPYIQQAERGLPVKETLITGTARLVEDTLNLPKTVANLFGSDLPYEFKFGRKLSDKLEENIPLKERQEKIKQFEIPRGIVDDMELLSDQEFDKMSEVNPEKFKKLMEASEKPQIEPEERTTKPPQSLFTPLPTDKIVGEVDDQIAGALMDSFPNQSFLQYQSAVEDGFQGSFEDYLQQQSMKLAQGGRVGFQDGSPDPIFDQIVAALDNTDLIENLEEENKQTLKEQIYGDEGDRTLMQTFNTMYADPSAYPYYAQEIASGAANIPELAFRFPFAVTGLVSDLATGRGDKLKRAMETLDPKLTKAIKEKIGFTNMLEESRTKRTGPQRTTGGILELGAEVPGPATPYFLIKAFPKIGKQIRNLVGTAASADKVNKEIEKKLAGENVDQTRRDILLATGAGGAIALLKFLGLDNLIKTTKIAKAAPEIVTKGGTPKYFFDFVNLIKTKGNDVTDKASTIERQKVYDYDGYTMYEDITTGKISIRKDTEGGANYYIGDGEYETVEGIIRKEEIIYEPPETIIGKDGKPQKVPDMYEENTLKPDYDGTEGDVEGGLDSIDEILELLAKEGNKYSLKELKEMGINPEALGSYKPKKAEGGIIAGASSGPPPKSGPTPHGLPYVAKNVRPIKERR